MKEKRLIYLKYNLVQVLRDEYTGKKGLVKVEKYTKEVYYITIRFRYTFKGDI
jgi:hypothetical protein